MEACSDTFRPDEVDFSCEGERGLGESFDNCKKNPGHTMFIPVNELTMKHLPSQHRNDKTLDWIKRLANRTVKLSVKYVSPHRPSQLKWSMLAGEKVLSVGSGFLTDVNEEEMQCPIKNCTELPGQHPVFGYITITTASHVVCDDAEAESTTVEFFYDNPGDKSGVVTCRGVKVVTASIEGDFCELLCVAHDREMFNRIKGLTSIRPPPNCAQTRVCGLFDAFSNLKCISLSKSEDGSEVISIHIDKGNSTTCKDLVSSLMECDLSKIFANVTRRTILDEPGLTGTSFSVDRLVHRIIKVSSCNLDIELDIPGTASMVDYSLFMDILRCLQEETFSPLRNVHFTSYATSMLDRHYCPMSSVKHFRNNTNSWASILNYGVLKSIKNQNGDNDEKNDLDNNEDNDEDHDENNDGVNDDSNYSVNVFNFLKKWENSYGDNFMDEIENDNKMYEDNDEDNEEFLYLNNNNEVMYIPKWWVNCNVPQQGAHSECAAIEDNDEKNDGVNDDSNYSVNVFNFLKKWENSYGDNFMDEIENDNKMYEDNDEDNYDDNDEDNYDDNDEDNDDDMYEDNYDDMNEDNDNDNNDNNDEDNDDDNNDNNDEDNDDDNNDNNDEDNDDDNDEDNDDDNDEDNDDDNDEFSYLNNNNEVMYIPKWWVDCNVPQQGAQSVCAAIEDGNFDRELTAIMKDAKKVNGVIKKYKKSLPCSNFTTTNVGATNVGATNVGATSVGATSVATSIVATTNIATTNVDTTNVGATNVGATSVATSIVATTNIATTNVATINAATTHLATSNVATTTVAAKNVAAKLEPLLRRVNMRRIKFEDFFRILHNNNQQSFDKLRIDGNTLILDYRFAEKRFTDLCTQSNIPAPNNDDIVNPNPWVVHISHPHGKSKMVTFGSLTDFNNCRGYFYPLYTAPTCPGSSGGPTFVLPETCDLDQIYGMLHTSYQGNMINRGCAWTIYPTL